MDAPDDDLAGIQPDIPDFRTHPPHKFFRYFHQIAGADHRLFPVRFNGERRDRQGCFHLFGRTLEKLSVQCDFFFRCDIRFRPTEFDHGSILSTV